ncbi:MAG TPA: spirocyclase AveC family protein [Acidimicrobiales bacterium]
MTTLSESRTTGDFTGGWADVTDDRVGRPVNYWAWAGLTCLVFQIAVYIAWGISGEAVATPTGPTRVPDSMQNAATAMVAAGLAVTVAMVGWFVLRPALTERRLPIDGVFLLALPTVAWQVVLPNYNQLTMLWNSHYANLGSWGPSIPGWLPPGGDQLAIPLLWLVAVVGGLVFPGIVVANALMSWIRRRSPEMGMVGLLAITFGVLGALALVAETLFLRAGVYSYAGGLRWLSLWGDAHHQLPVYQPVLLAATWTGFAAMRFFRNELGEIIPWRGLDRVHGSAPRRGIVRFAAVAGLMNFLAFLLWSVPTAALGVYADEFPVDVLERSYLTNGVCGPNTDYHCPGPDIPIPRPDSAYITPAGELARP